MTADFGKHEILEEFALDAQDDSKALERYLQEYPDLATDLVDLARELMRPLPSNPAPLSASEEALVDVYWEHYVTGTRLAAEREASLPATAVLRGRPVQDLRTISKNVGVPRQVISALREGRVIFASIPEHFLELLATAAAATTEALKIELRKSVPARAARSFKADSKIEAARQISLEQTLIDAGVSESDLKRLLGTD
jgi:hypothetical protein